MLIRSEDDAWEYLFHAWRDPDFGSQELVNFEGWPKLTLRLDPGDGRSNRQIIRAEALMQRHVDLLFLLAKRGELTGNLSVREQQLLNIHRSIRSGSTVLDYDYVQAFRTLIGALPESLGKRRRSLVTIGAVLATLGTPTFCAYMSYRGQLESAQITSNGTIRAAEIQADATVRAAHIAAETSIQQAHLTFGDGVTAPDQRQVMLATLASLDTSNIVSFAASDYVPWKPALLLLPTSGGTMQWNNEQPVPSALASAVATKAKKNAREARRVAKANGRPGLIETPWMTEVIRVHGAPGAMKLGITDA